MNRLNVKILWAYGSEVVFSSLVLFFLCVLFDISTLANFIKIIATDFATYFSVVMLGGSIAFFWVFYSKSDTLFSQWLYDKGAYNVYLAAYVSAIGIYASLTILLVLTQQLNSELLSLITLWLLILGVVNLYTFIDNIIKQLKLNMEFNRKTRGRN